MALAGERRLMGTSRRRSRRRFGALKRISKNGRVYVEASYPTPLWAFAQWPGLPKRQYKVVAPEYELEAETWLARAEKDIEFETWTPPQLDRARQRMNTTTFREYADQWLEKRRKGNGDPLQETTKEKYREELRLYLYPAFGDTPIALIGPDDVQRWWDSFVPDRLSEGANLRSRRHAVYSKLRAIMNTAATEPVDIDGNTLIPDSPCKIKTAPAPVAHKPVILENRQIHALFLAFPKWLRLAVYLSGYGGLREGECLALLRSNINLDDRLIHVRLGAKRERGEDGSMHNVIGTTKTASSERDIEIKDFLVPIIREHLDQFVDKEPDSLLFPAPRKGGVCAGQTLRNALLRAKTKLPELSGMRFHDLRETYLSTAHANGATPGELMREAGHATISTASKYQHRVESHWDEVNMRLSAKVAAEGGIGHLNDSLDDYLAGLKQTEKAPRSHKNGPQTAEHAIDDQLITYLEEMPLQERLKTMRELDPELRAKILDHFGPEARIETVRGLLKEER